MEEKVKNAIEEYQCSGCISGCDISCFEKNESHGEGCGKHYAGTMVLGVGKFFLGLPKGFCRLGEIENFKPIILKSYDDDYNMWNVPVWKYLNENGHTLVRGIMPRRNEPFLHIFLENCMDKINCLEITQDDIDGMD